MKKYDIVEDIWEEKTEQMRVESSRNPSKPLEIDEGEEQQEIDEEVGEEDMSMGYREDEEEDVLEETSRKI